MFDSFAASKVSRRRFLTSSAVSIGALAGTGALLDACNTSTSSSAPGTTTLTVMYAASEFTPAYVKQFEQLHPSIKISFIEFDQTRLNAMFAAGTPPDFIRGSAVGSVSNSARGLALNLDPYLAKSSVLKTSDFLGINNSWRWDGKKVGQGSYYGITKDWSQDQTLWYNQALLEKAGISPLSPTEPITYDQLFTMATKLTTRQGGKTLVYGYGTQWAWGLMVIVSMMIKQQGGEIYNAAETQADFTTPAAQKAIEWFINYEQAKIGPSSLDPAPDGWDGPDLLANRMAIMMGGFWVGGSIAGGSADNKANLRLAPAPLMGPTRFSPSSAGVGAWIPKTSKHPDEAWALMEYFMAGQPAHDRAKSGWGIPSLKSLLPEVPQTLPYQQEAYQSLQSEIQHVGTFPDSPYITTGTYNTILQKYIQQAAQKQITLTSACQQITQDANTAIQQGIQQLS